MKTLNLLTLTFLTALLSTSAHAEKFNDEIDALDYCLSVGDVTKASVEEVKKGMQRTKELLKEMGYDETNPFSFEVVTPFWFFAIYVVSSILSIFNKKAFFVLNFLLVGFNIYLYF